VAGHGRLAERDGPPGSGLNREDRAAIREALMGYRASVGAGLAVPLAVTAWLSPQSLFVVEAQKVRQQEVRVQAAAYDPHIIAVLVTQGGVGVDSLGPAEIDAGGNPISLPDGWTFQVPLDGSPPCVSPTYFQNLGGGAYILVYGQVGECLFKSNPAFIITISTPGLAGGTVGVLRFTF
jgi:hypothetical protein